MAFLFTETFTWSNPLKHFGCKCQPFSSRLESSENLSRLQGCMNHQPILICKNKKVFSNSLVWAKRRQHTAHVLLIPTSSSFWSFISKRNRAFCTFLPGIWEKIRPARSLPRSSVQFHTHTNLWCVQSSTRPCLQGCQTCPHLESCRCQSPCDWRFPVDHSC